ncbi:hypothetical protein IQ269_01980 [Tychonema sp. LEGE 07199]|uniref:hypothetical protein n=1 Tax=unclassified Tychonema TaxID=2642144 RepID=UPI00187F4F1B|nr:MULTISPECIES: hypothetical protein [unclassified Tychonema]MBE9119603.1 hypothetical protein [Tychonema sp. LEGE 07199]MBE9131807.1 hypothetical protein [Tychonema sp. LEGE 07196]
MMRNRRKKEEERRKYVRFFCSGFNGCNGCKSVGRRKKKEGRRKKEEGKKITFLLVIIKK